MSQPSPLAWATFPAVWNVNRPLSHSLSRPLSTAPTRRRPRSRSSQHHISPVLCSNLSDDNPSTISPPDTSDTSNASSTPPNHNPPTSSSTQKFGLLTDSILELKWKTETGDHQSPTTLPTPSQSPSDASPADEAAPSAPHLDHDQLLASDPYKAFAHFTRLAAPTAALGRDDAKSLVPLSDRLNLMQRDSPYSAASIAHRLMRYTYARKNLDEFIHLFQGEFDNYHQIAQERRAGMFAGDGGGHEHIHCSIQRISPDLLFARYYFNGDPNIVFRSRLYRVCMCDQSERGLIEMRIFRFYEETEQRLKANNYDIHAIQWSDDDVYDWLEGCEVFWEHYLPAEDDVAGQMLGIQPGSRFVGYMKGGGCEFYSREIGGRIRVMDDLLLTSQDLWVADRGFDEHDNFVYGNRRGVPYKMRRVGKGDENEWTIHADQQPPDGYIC